MAALSAAAGDVEELHGVRVELASAGDCPVDAAVGALVREHEPVEVGPHEGVVRMNDRLVDNLDAPLRLFRVGVRDERLEPLERAHQRGAMGPRAGDGAVQVIAVAFGRKLSRR